MVSFLGIGCQAEPIATIPASASSDSTEFERAWSRYLADPTSEHAKAVTRVVPVQPADEAARARLLLIDGLDVLEDHVAGSDTAALRLAFRLQRISDAHASEWLGFITDSAMRPMASAWLRAAHAEGISAQRLGWLAGSSIFYDEVDVQRAELRARRDSLLSVTDPELRALRDSIVAMIASELEELP